MGSDGLLSLEINTQQSNIEKQNRKLGANTKMVDWRYEKRHIDLIQNLIKALTLS